MTPPRSRGNTGRPGGSQGHGGRSAGRPGGPRGGGPTASEGGRPERPQRGSSGTTKKSQPTRVPRERAIPEVDVHDPDGIRLQKLLAAAGVGSRRVCENLISAGRVEVEGQDHLVIPYTLDANDFKFLLPGGFVTADDFQAYLVDSFDRLLAEGGRMLSVGLHCRIVGRPGRAPALERFLAHVRAHEGVWVATRSDIARHWRAAHPPRESKS